MSLQFTVRGTPVTQGSKRAFVNKSTGRAQVVDDNRAPLKSWRLAVAAAAQAALGLDRASPFLDCPVAVRLDFRLARPKSVSPAKRPFPSVKPDLDKLVRACLDSLTDARLLTDDAQVVQLHATKTYDEPPGVTIRIVPA